ncbi:hypothetical protein ABLT91_13810 [Acinetobacter pittii]|jgi:hypothetical protein|uniref:primase 1D-like protein n=1 Tax=Acinetobacter pittii TaxID=48296 RepID=UPI0024DE5759|nr:hypothetical protein [Acinetobacter pittii]
MINTSHPFFFLKNFLDSDSTYSLSKYIYLPDSLSDERIITQVSGYNFDLNFVNTTICSLDYDQELAFHSIIKTKYGKKLHIPMIDFSTDNLNIDVYYRLKNFIDYKILSNMVFYSSGNSFHAYSSKLLTHKEWLNFMGSLLLVNPPHSSHNIIDTRWIGHRIRSGFSALRWSNNSGTYKAVPKKTDINLF